MRIASPSRSVSYPLTILILMGFMATLGVRTGSAQELPTEARSKGVVCLFAGHSFFIPVAQSFHQIAGNSDFPDHRMKYVFRGGQGGTAGAMWANQKTRERVEAILEAGDVELFGLTPGLSDTAETFQPWFDLALKHNPDTRFFVGVPWSIGGPSMKTDQFDQLVDSYAAKGLAVVKELRARYPDSRIDYLAYGKVAPAMKSRFEAGTLPDIELMAGPGRTALFSDNQPGHAGPMMLELCALTWMNLLYDANVDSLTCSPEISNAPEIVTEVLEFNAPFNALPTTKSTPPITTK